MKWKTSKELKNELHNYVLQTADDLIIGLREKRKKWEKWEIKSNKNILCMK
jgi:hypothetical protein